MSFIVLSNENVIFFFVNNNMLIRHGNRRGAAFGNIAIGRVIMNKTAIIIGLFNEYEMPAIFIRTR